MVTAHSPAWSLSEVPECGGLASGRWLKATQAYRKMRPPAPSGSQAGGLTGEEHPKKQLTASGAPQTRGLYPLCQSAASLSGFGGCGGGGVLRPLPTHPQAKAGASEPALTRVGDCMEELEGPFKERLAFVCNGKERSP